MAASFFEGSAFTQSLFFPRPDRSPCPEGASDVHLPVAPGAKVHVRVHGANDGHCTVLLFHGNGEVVADYDGVAQRFRQAGATLAVADFRGYGESTGSPTLEAVVADARVIAGAVCHAAKRPVIVMGRSLGGIAAHELYANPIDGIGGVILESAMFDLAGLVRRRGLEAPAQFSAADRERFDPAAKLPRGRTPLLLLHGEQDTLISAREAHAALDVAGSASKRLVLIPQRGHNDVSHSDVYWNAVTDFLADLRG